MKRVIAVVAAGLVSVFLIACGEESGSDSDSATSGLGGGTPALTKAEFINAADEICSQFREESKSLEQEVANSANANDYQAMGNALKRLLDLASQTSNEVDALEINNERDAEVVAEISENRAKGLTILELMVDAVKEEDNMAISAYADELESLNQKTKGLSVGFGFQVCGSED